MLDFIKEIKRKREESRLEQEKHDQEIREQNERQREERQQKQREAEILRKQQIEDAKKKKCPYCNFVIDKEPKGKFKCPSCKNEIHIQKSGQEIILLTLEQREELNSERKERAAQNKYFIFFQNSGILDDREYLEERRIEWLKKFPYNGNYDDLTWSLAHEILQALVKHREYQRASSIYFALALFQRERGKPFFHLLKERQVMTLYDYKYSPAYEGIEIKVGVITCGCSSCPACRELEGKRFTIDEALEQMPIPVKGCTSDGGWCQCLYSVHVIR